MNLSKDQRIVMTLDAGRTNLVFSVIQAGKELVISINNAPNPKDLEACLQIIIAGFKELKAVLRNARPIAISFAFPGLADLKNGIIGDLPSFPFFRDGLVLGPMLENLFGLPTSMNNDGDLSAYREAMGFLPELNVNLKIKTLRNTIKTSSEITLGTYF